MAVASAAPSAEKSTEDKPASKQPQVGDVLHANLGIIERAVASKETRLLFGRVLRTTASVRGQFTATSLKSFMSKTLPETSTIRDFVLKHLEGGDTVRFDHALVHKQLQEQPIRNGASSCRTWKMLMQLGIGIGMHQYRVDLRSLRRSCTVCSCYVSSSVIRRSGARCVTLLSRQSLYNTYVFLACAEQGQLFECA